MTVKELIEILSRMNQYIPVILQKDAEGNGYSPLRGADDVAVYVAETTYSGTVYGEQDIMDGYGKGGVPCVVLHPVN